VTRKLKLAELTTRDFRTALGHFATGVCIVTAPAPEPGRYAGITVNSFASVSLEPPLVLFSLARSARSFTAFQAADHFAVNVLAAEQQQLSRVFARSTDDKWEGVAFELWDHDCPILPGGVASFECRKHAVHDGGDHLIYVGFVEHMSFDSEREPLLYLHGGYGAFQRGD